MFTCVSACSNYMNLCVFDRELNERNTALQVIFSLKTAVVGSF